MYAKIKVKANHGLWTMCIEEAPLKRTIAKESFYLLLGLCSEFLYLLLVNMHFIANSYKNNSYDFLNRIWSKSFRFLWALQDCKLLLHSFVNAHCWVQRQVFDVRYRRISRKLPIYPRTRFGLGSVLLFIICFHQHDFPTIYADKCDDVKAMVILIA